MPIYFTLVISSLHGITPSVCVRPIPTQNTTSSFYTLSCHIYTTHRKCILNGWFLQNKLISKHISSPSFCLGFHVDIVFLHETRFLRIFSSFLVNSSATSAFCLHNNIFNTMETSWVGGLGLYYAQTRRFFQINASSIYI